MFLCFQQFSLKNLGPFISQESSYIFLILQTLKKKKKKKKKVVKLLLSTFITATIDSSNQQDNFKIVLIKKYISKTFANLF